MKKKIVFILMLLFVLTGCVNESVEVKSKKEDIVNVDLNETGDEFKTESAPSVELLFTRYSELDDVIKNNKSHTIVASTTFTNGDSQKVTYSYTAGASIYKIDVNLSTSDGALTFKYDSSISDDSVTNLTATVQGQTLTQSEVETADSTIISGLPKASTAKSFLDSFSDSAELFNSELGAYLSEEDLNDMGIGVTAATDGYTYSFDSLGYNYTWSASSKKLTLNYTQDKLDDIGAKSASAVITY